MLSRYSDNSVAAVGVVNQLMNLVFLLFEVISLGTSILCSQYIGAGQREKVIQTVGTSLLFNSIFGLLVSVALLFLAEDLLLLMGLRPNLMADGLPYMQIVGGLAFLQAISLSLSASLRSADKAKYPMYVSMVVNVLSQMKELITQNYNHPSIVVWGLSNEITMNGDKDPDLIDNHRVLNELVKEMDKTRLTTMACVSMCPMDAEYIKIPDVVSYNHYFGWYGGTTDMNGPWFDKFHEMHPNIPIGVSEYGCEALNWHTSNPTQGDYTEEYQAFYHEELIKQLFTRKYIWATHVWNMYDFGADARSEGGENGQNHKGLMTMDRKYKKDSFYAYKAWLSDEPFVHLCGKRYIDRVEEITKVTVYSNLPEVELFVNGESIGKKTAEDHFFYFEVKNEGESTITAVAGEYKDEGTIRKVDVMNEDYVLKEKGAVLNWFDVDAPAGRYSINDTIGNIMKSTRGKLWFLGFGLKLKKKMDQNKKGSDGKKDGFSVDLKSAGSGMMQMLSGFTVLRMTSMLSMVNVSFTKEELLSLNKKLNRVRKPKELR